MKAVKNWNLEKGQWLTRKVKTDEEKTEKKMRLEGGGRKGGEAMINLSFPISIMLSTFQETLNEKEGKEFLYNAYWKKFNLFKKSAQHLSNQRNQNLKDRFLLVNFHFQFSSF